MIRRFVRNLALHLLSITEEGEQASNSTPTLQDFDESGKNLLEARRENRQPFTAGSIQLLGLDALKRQLGPIWVRFSPRIMGIAERVLRAHLTSADSYTKHSDDTYVIFFALMREAEAREMAQTISTEIERTVRKELPMTHSVTVEHFVAELDDIVFEDALDGSQSLASVVLTSLSQIRAEARQTASNRRAGLLRSARFVFRPVWSPSKRAVMLFRCMLDASSGAAAVEHLTAISDGEQLIGALADLDCLLLGKAISALHDVFQRDRKSMMIVPVHFCTLSAPQFASEYVRLCREMPEPYRKFIFFELHGAPAGTLKTSISEIARSLHPFSRGVFFLVGEQDFGLITFVAAEFCGFSVDLGALSRTDIAKILKHTVAIARKNGLLTLLQGANSIAQLQTAVDLDVDYVCGEAVQGSIDQPKSAYRYTPIGINKNSALSSLVGAGALP